MLEYASRRALASRVYSQDRRKCLLQTTMGSVGPEGYRIRKNAPVYLPTRVRVVVSCLKSASLSVCIFHNSLAGIFQREDPSRDKGTLRPRFFCFPFPFSFPLFSKNRRREGYKQKPLNCFPFVKYFSSRFRRTTFDHLTLRRSNSIMPLLRNKEKNMWKAYRWRECGHVCAQRNTSK